MRAPSCALAAALALAGCGERARPAAAAPPMTQPTAEDGGQDGAAGAAAAVEDDRPRTRVVTRMGDGGLLVEEEPLPDPDEVRLAARVVDGGVVFEERPVARPAATRIVTRVIDGQVIVEEVPLDAGAPRSPRLSLVRSPPAPSGADGSSREALEALVRAGRADRAARCALARELSPWRREQRAAPADDEAVQLLRRARDLCADDAWVKRELQRRLLALAKASQPGPEKRALLDEAFALDEKAHVAAMIGDAADEVNDMEAAVRAYERAVSLEGGERYRRALERLKGARDVEARFSSVTSPRFTVRYDGPEEERFARMVLEHLEKAYDDVKRRIGVAPKKPVTVIFYTKGGFDRAAGGPHWAAGIFDGKIRLRPGALVGAWSGATLTHEYVHAALSLGVRGRPPAWFHEGLADRLSAPPESRVEMLRPHLEKLKPTLKQMNGHVSGSGLPSVRMYYAAAYDIVDVLIEARGEEGVGRLLARMNDGLSFYEAMRDVYGFDAAELEKRWHARYPVRR